MTFYSVSDAKFTRMHGEEIEISLSALDCVLNGEKAIYASTELTSGMRLYSAMRDHGVKAAAELTQRMGDAWYTENISTANVKAGSRFAADIRAKLGGKPLVITPGPFSASPWKQPEYLAFWEKLIRTRVDAVWFNLNWQYSNGCTFEFSVAVDVGLEMFDDRGRPLDRHAAVQLIEAAIQSLRGDGFDVTKLCESLARVQPASTSAR